MLEDILIGNNYTNNEILLSELEIMCKVKFIDILHRRFVQGTFYLSLMSVTSNVEKKKKTFILLFFLFALQLI